MLVTTKEQFSKMLEVLGQAELIAIDTEATGVDYENRKLVGVSFCVKYDTQNELYLTWYLPFRHTDSVLGEVKNLPIEWLDQLKNVLRQPHTHFVLHNAKFDFNVLQESGLPVPNKWFDTMLLFHMWNENLFNFGLKSLGRQFIEEEEATEEKLLKKLVDNLGSWSAIPPDAMAPYAEKDALLTYRLFELVWPELQQSEMDMSKLWPEQVRYSETLRQVENQGVLIDCSATLELAQAGRQRQAEIRSLLGYDPLKRNALARRLFSSPPEGLGFVPGPRGKPSKSFPEGQPTMDDEFLSTLNHSEIDLVREYRRIDKEVGTYYEPWLELVDASGRLHPTYKIHGTITSRLSCASPNMQQVPREGTAKVKTVLRASDGYELWEFDYSQAELILAAGYANEESMVQAFRTGGDIHQLTADNLGIVRQDAKRYNFSVVYGGGAPTVSKQLGIKESEAKRKLAEFRRTYPALTRTAHEAEAAAQRSSEGVRLWTGRRCHFQWPSQHKDAFNRIIQGGVAQLIQKTACKLVLDTPEFKGKVVGLVHDSLWIELPVGNIEQIDLVVDVMTTWPEETFGIPFPVDYKRLGK